MRIPMPIAVAALLVAGSAACSAGTAAPPTAAPPASYLALPDTLVCVVDRAAPAGLAEIPAKKDGGSVVVFSGGEVVDLSTLHPVNIIAGYAGREGWMQRGDPIDFGGGRYSNIGGERRIALDLLDRVGEHRGILLFAGVDDDPPADALYVPTAPGCIFQPFVRDDLLRR